MKNFEEILENGQLNSWIQNFVPSPQKIHDAHEADAELIRIPGNAENYLAITIDSVSEEITAGLYLEPFTMGWVTIMANFSDLAATGATPVGIVTAVALNPEQPPEFNQQIAAGMIAACRELGVFVLGGDMNTAPVTSLTGCAIGLVPQNKVLTRKGCQPGDLLFLSGKAGMGSALGLFRFAHLPHELFAEHTYRPVARIKEGQLIRNHATCCMDTSDGVLTTLDQLMRINNTGFKITTDLNSILEPAALHLVEVAGLPEWTLLAGHHGEFELIFTVPSDQAEKFGEVASEYNWQPLPIGEVIEEQGIFWQQPNRILKFDTTRIRNLFPESKGDMKYYISEVGKCCQKI